MFYSQEKLIDGIATLEKENRSQIMQHNQEISSMREEKSKVRELDVYLFIIQSVPLVNINILDKIRWHNSLVERH